MFFVKQVNFLYSGKLDKESAFVVHVPCFVLLWFMVHGVLRGEAMALCLNYPLSFLMLFVSVVSADIASLDSSYYEYCRLPDRGERRQECRLLRDENVIFRAKYEAKRQTNPGGLVAPGNGSELSPASSTRNSLAPLSSSIAASHAGAGVPGTDQALDVDSTANANSTVANTSVADAVATAAAVSTSSAAAVSTSSAAVNTTVTAGGGDASGNETTHGNLAPAGGVPIVASDVMVINSAEIRNNSVPSGEERSDLFHKFRDMMNNTRPRQNDSLLEDDQEFDDLINRFNEIVNNNHTLKENNITKYEEDHHSYYNSSFVVSEEIGQKFWVTLSERENVQVNEVLSRAHRRAVTVRLSFDFPFYGHLIRNVTVATGGFLFTGEYVHSWLAATQYVAPLMANFDTSLSNASAIKYVDNGTAFTVEWENVILRDEPHFGEFTFQVTLHANGDIVFVYKHIPVIVENIRDSLHPVKVGLSDAYISDRVIFLIRRKTIYEYHRVEFNKEDIRNWTVIYLSALPTCVSKTSCFECLTQVPGFQCNWCPSIERCSNGVDRHRKDWLGNGCDRSAYESVHMCPGMKQRIGAVSVGCGEDGNKPQQSTLAQESDVHRPHNVPSRPVKRKVCNIIAACETAETVNLTNSELQRLVLLKQLEVLDLKKKKLMQELGHQEVVYSNHVCESVECVATHLG
ncbi:uncharacterized protein LOC134530958 isoform X2 [Bacillus rossius redtenbacheri]|uniref:uncharacterized protein LOC134530958 isoform X2 n=1 Tax=Bacillus rossius redtenbacheri TaxID=93214 RepID=UPI002FDDB050